MTCVLVVEDDPWIQWMIADDLVDRGYTVITAEDGLEGLQRIRETRPDVIVLDLMLPRLDGWEFAERCKTAMGGEAIPIVVVSSARNQTIAAGAPGVCKVLPKPFDMEELASTVAQIARPQAVVAGA